MDRTISHYRVLHPLGSGGMGDVYAGIDETLKRRVALKAIRAEHRLSAVSKARFLREARILSQLDHPNVCRVYDFIEDTDSDWLVLELIEGKTLQTALRAQIDSASRLRIALQVADVLVATHAAGVVHRDLKPGNIMLTRGDEVKVLDFGLAHSDEYAAPAAIGSRAVEDYESDPAATMSSDGSGFVLATGEIHVHTEGGALMGTPAYMSPEQARGEQATLASDMYAFGLVLQELYTGRAPYPSDIHVGELLERARRAETLAPVGVPRDMAALITRLKQLAPGARPGAVEVAARLRWIRNGPKRLAQRTLAAALLLTAVLGTRKYTIDLARQKTLAIAARDDADRRRGQAEDLIGFMLGDLRKRLEPVGRLDILDAVGDKSMAYFAAVPEGTLTDGELLRRSAALYQIGDVRIAQGNLVAATPPLLESLALAKMLVDRNPKDGERLFGLAQSHYWVGFVHFRRNDLLPAEREFQAYLDIATRLTGLDPARADWQQELAYANSNIGSVLQARGELAGALARFRACLSIEEALHARSPADSGLRQSIATSHNLIGVILRSNGQLDEALAEFNEEFRIRAALSSSEPANATFRFSLGIGRVHMAYCLAAKGLTTDAIEAFEQAQTIFRDLSERDPANRRWQQSLASAYFNLGQGQLVQGRQAAALPLCRRAVDIMQTLTKADPTDAGWRRNLAAYRLGLGGALLANGDIDGAAREASACLNLTSGLTADPLARPIASGAEALAARTWMARGQAALARTHWQLALDAIEKAAGGSTDYRFLDPLAVALVNLDRQADAAPVIRSLLKMGYREPTFLRSIGRTGPGFLPDADDKTQRR